MYKPINRTIQGAAPDCTIRHLKALEKMEVELAELVDLDESGWQTFEGFPLGVTYGRTNSGKHLKRTQTLYHDAEITIEEIDETQYPK